MARHTTGFGTTISITADAKTVTFEEVTVTYPGIQGNEKIEQTSNQNTGYKSYVPGDLKEVTDTSATVFYSTDEWADILAIINISGALTLTFKNGDSIGDTDAWLVSAVPTGATINERPTMDIVVSFAGETDAGVATQTVTAT
jgi:hypothetical protein